MTFEPKGDWIDREHQYKSKLAQSAAEIAGLRAEVERLRAENETLKQRLRDLNSVFSGIEIYMPDNVKIKIDLARLACEKTTAKQ
jgi:predicted nuclease with TOPRIM domain